MMAEQDPAARERENKERATHLVVNGFFLRSSELYGGVRKLWDAGPRGAELKQKLKNLWWRYFVTNSVQNVGYDAAILTDPLVLQASGHLTNFFDWVIECQRCRTAGETRSRYRVSEVLAPAEQARFAQLDSAAKANFPLPFTCSCGSTDFTPPYPFSTLFRVEVGERLLYLRPETAQQIFINFLAIQRATHRSLPFGVGQIGKSFRNEVTLRHGLFRTFEFEQLELEFFHSAGESDFWWDHWNHQAWTFLQRLVVNHPSRLQQVAIPANELPFYSRRSLDLFYHYSFGWGELCSNSDRGTYDLQAHFQAAKVSYPSEIPAVVEVSFGLERLALAVLEDAYWRQPLPDGERAVLRLSPLLAPYFLAVIPHQKKFRAAAKQLLAELQGEAWPFNVTYEEASRIGKAYYRQDAIGTYYCLTLTAESLQEQQPTLTVRRRDSREQFTLPLSQVKEWFSRDYQEHFQAFFRS